MTDEMIEVETGKTWPTFWHMISDDPNEVYDLSMRSKWINVLLGHIEKMNWTAQQAAEAYKVNDAVITQLLEADITEFDLGKLTAMAKAAKIGF